MRMYTYVRVYIFMSKYNYYCLALPTYVSVCILTFNYV